MACASPLGDSVHDSHIIPVILYDRHITLVILIPVLLYDRHIILVILIPVILYDI